MYTYRYAETYSVSTYNGGMCMDLGRQCHYKVSEINYGNIFTHILNQFFHSFFLFFLWVLSRTSIKLGITSCKVANEIWRTIHCGRKKNVDTYSLCMYTCTIHIKYTHNHYICIIYTRYAALHFIFIEFCTILEYVSRKWIFMEIARVFFFFVRKVYMIKRLVYHR